LTPKKKLVIAFADLETARQLVRLKEGRGSTLAEAGSVQWTQLVTHAPTKGVSRSWPGTKGKVVFFPASLITKEEAPIA